MSESPASPQSTRFVVVARYTIKDDEVPRVLALLRELATESRREPANLGYELYRGVDDERSVAIIERYESADAFAVHRASEHFQRLAVEGILPLLASRVVETFPDPQYPAPQNSATG